MRNLILTLFALLFVTGLSVNAQQRRSNSERTLTLAEAQRILDEQIDRATPDTVLFTCRACFDPDDKYENDNFPIVTSYSESLSQFLIRKGYIRINNNGQGFFTAKAKQSEYFEAFGDGTGRLGGAGFRFAHFKNPKIKVRRITDPKNVPIEFDAEPTALTREFFGTVTRMNTSASFSYEDGRWSVCIACKESSTPSPSVSFREQKDTPQAVWTELERGKSGSDFHFSRYGTLLYRGRQITGIKFNSTVEKIAVSSTAVGGKFAICVTFDRMDSAGYLLQLNSYSGKQLRLQGPPYTWAAWSPAGTHVIIGSYYEADETLYSVSLPSGNVRKFSFNLAKSTEEESYDSEKLTWIDNKVFRLRVMINCNPYTDDNCSDQARQKVLREYEIKANVATLVSDIKELSPTLSLRADEKKEAEENKVYTDKEVDIKANVNKLEARAQFKSDCPDEVDVILRLTLHKSGKVTDVTLIKGGGCSFDIEAIKAVRTLKFTPAMKNGRPVSQYLEYEFAAGRIKPTAVDSVKNSRPAPGLVKIRARPGDTPAKIARRYNVSEREVAELNGVGISTEFQPGQEISIPSLPSEPSLDESAKPAQSPPR